MNRLMAVLFSLLLPVRAFAQADRVDSVVRSFMEKTHIPGAAVAVVRNGRVESIRSFGIANSEYGVAVTPETRFQLASGSKLFTSAVLLRMVEQGRLRLEDPISQYISGAPASWKEITILDLARHVSGLAAPEVDTNITSSAAVVELAEKTPPEAKPGERASYGDFDYPILQFILEKVSGKPFAELMEDELFRPVGFACTMYDNLEQHGAQRMSLPVPNRAEYYRWVGSYNQKREFLYTRWAYAAGGAYACAKDAAAFIAALDAGKVISPTSLKLARTTPRLADGSSSKFGIGCVIGRYRGHAWMGHSGGPAFSDMVYFPEDHFGIVVLTNQQKLYPELAMLVADELLTNPIDSRADVQKDLAPELTAAARKLIDGMASGKIDPSLLAPDKRGEYLEDLSDFAPGWLGPLEPVTRMELVGDSAGIDGARRRRYRLFFGAHPQEVVFGFDKTGKIESLSPEGS